MSTEKSNHKTITVNGEAVSAVGDVISYETIVYLADRKPGADVVFCSPSTNPGRHATGRLRPDSLPVRSVDGMSFIVTDSRERDLPVGKFKLGDRVRKIKGAQWQGHVCGWYSTELTEIGLCVKSEREVGSVQIYPESALELVPEGE